MKYDFFIAYYLMNPNSLSGDMVRVLKTDSRDRLWISTEKGLSLYNAEKDCFINYSFESEEPATITDIEEIYPD